MPHATTGKCKVLHCFWCSHVSKVTLMIVRSSSSEGCERTCGHARLTPSKSHKRLRGDDAPVATIVQ
uniref:Uncharacterized protein n=1 Tax=Anopheles albimanus TaxID=7167 RepID=A0A182FXF5_ANOAL